MDSSILAQAGIIFRTPRRLAALAFAVFATGCSTIESITPDFLGTSPAQGSVGYVKGFLGGAVGDEPQSVLVAKNVLSSGGNATDAAVAGILAMTVTYPSRAGLGGGGACLAYAAGKNGPGGGAPEAIVFLPEGAPTVKGDRSAAVPGMARGLFAMQARYGRQSFASLVGPAEQLARLGFPASRALVRDIAVVAGPLAGDPVAGAVFLRNGTAPAEGTLIAQPDLSASLAQLRTAGVGDLYQGSLGRRFAEAAQIAGGGLTVEDMRTNLPRLLKPIILPYRGGDSVAFLPPPADGGLAGAAAFKVLMGNASDMAGAQSRALSVASAWRARGGDAQALLDNPPDRPSTMTVLPASTSFATLDREGNAVVCALTMNNLFGTGRIAPGTGILLAASPNRVPPPLLAAAIAYNPNLRAFRAAVGASGQEAAALALASGMRQVLTPETPGPTPLPANRADFYMQGALPPTFTPSWPTMGEPTIPSPGRINLISCAGYLPGAENSCSWLADPRNAGLAVGSN